MSIGVIQQAARERKRWHVGLDGFCTWCGEAFPCPDFVAAERIVHAADALAATHEKIRAHAERIVNREAAGHSERLKRGKHTSQLGFTHEDAEAILGLLSEKPTEPDDEPLGECQRCSAMAADRDYSGCEHCRTANEETT